MIRFNNKVTHVGLVVDLYRTTEDCGYDTVYHAWVWDWTTLSAVSVYYGDTRTGNVGTAEVDATPDVLEAYAIYKHNCKVRAEYNLVETQTYTGHIGFTVEVMRGRLVPKGTVGIVTSRYETQWGVKLIITDANGVKHKTYCKNVEVKFVPLSFGPKIAFKKYSDNFLTLYKRVG